MNHSRDAGRPRAALWDLDGTLTDTGSYHWQAWQQTMAIEGRPIDFESFSATFGQRNDLVLRVFFGPDLPQDEVERIGDAKEALYRRLVHAGGVEMLPGVAAWLARLADDGWHQAVASSAPRANIDAVLDALGITACFEAVVAAEDVTHGKPAPDVYLVAAQRLRVAPDRCIVIEDAPAGVEGARRAAMRAIAVRSSHDNLDADVVVSSLADLPCDAFDRLVPRAEPPARDGSRD